MLYSVTRSKSQHSITSEISEDCSLHLYDELLPNVFLYTTRVRYTTFQITFFVHVDYHVDYATAHTRQ